MATQLLKELNQRPIAYYPFYRELTGSTTAAILLSQLMYWFNKKDKIFKTDEEIKQETYLTKKELENAKKLIKKLPFITVSVEGIPAKTYYEIDWEKYENLLMKDEETEPQKVEASSHEMGKQVSTKGGNCVPPKVETNKNNNFNTETTTETTKKNIQKNKTSFPTDDKELLEYSILKASSSDINCPLETYQSFKDHHIAVGSKFSDWQRAFNTWVNNFFKYKTKNEKERVQLLRYNIKGTYSFADNVLFDSELNKYYKVGIDVLLEEIYSQRVKILRGV
jgi:hypothetical protein